ncbi:MAG: hypothetical protein ACTSQY_06525 [Candidatus Odinarchaeia archaeon]
MPLGLIVIRWDNKVGAVLEAKTPRNLNVTDDHVMRIFTTHALGNSAPGFLSMKIEELNVASYYSGDVPNREEQFCISLILDADEDSEAFEEILAEIADDIINAYGTPKFIEILNKGFEMVTKATELDEDQRFALIFSDPIRIAVLNKLTEGSITQKELADWIKETKGVDVTDMNLVLAPFIKTGLIRLSFVEGIADECIFLIKDVHALRAPEVDLVTKARNRGYRRKLSKSYLTQVESFFKNYDPNQEDVMKLAKLYADPEIYSLIKLLRAGPIKEEEIASKCDIVQRDLKTLLKTLENVKVITKIKDEDGNNWVFLLSDLKFIKFYPEYLIDIIKQRWNEGSIQQNQALRHLDFLKEAFT